MTWVEFRQDKDLVAQWAGELRENALVRLVMQCLEESHPARCALNADNNNDISPTKASLELGVTRGYSMYADRLKWMGKLSLDTASQTPETTYTEPSTKPT